MTSASPRLRVEAACQQLGRDEFISRCVAMLDGGEEEPAFVVMIGGSPELHLLSQGIPKGQSYWLRVWAARGMLWAGRPNDGEALRTKVVARHRVDELLDEVIALEVDPATRFGTQPLEPQGGLSKDRMAHGDGAQPDIGDTWQPADMAVLRGRVASGEGDLNRWMEQYSDEYAAATGLRLYPGSLNILLDDPWQLPDETLQVSEVHVGRLVHLVPCLFLERSCFLFRTDNAERIGGDEHLILEVLSDVRLRSAHGLSDGDIVEVTVGS